MEKSPAMTAIEVSRRLPFAAVHDQLASHKIGNEIVFREALAVLYEAVENAPHGEDCETVGGYAEHHCNCWKAEALKAADDLCAKLLGGGE